MAEFTSITAMMAYAQSQVTNALHTDVSGDVRKIGQNHVQTDVYNAYHSKHSNSYERTGQLLEDEEVFIVDDNTIELMNNRVDEYTGRDVAQVIEQGYPYYTLELDLEIGARPFMENTREELEKGALKASMKKALEKRFGIGNVI